MFDILLRLANNKDQIFDTRECLQSLSTIKIA